MQSRPSLLFLWLFILLIHDILFVFESTVGSICNSRVSCACTLIKVSVLAWNYICTCHNCLVPAGAEIGTVYSAAMMVTTSKFDSKTGFAGHKPRFLQSNNWGLQLIAYQWLPLVLPYDPDNLRGSRCCGPPPQRSNPPGRAFCDFVRSSI